MRSHDCLKRAVYLVLCLLKFEIMCTFNAVFGGVGFTRRERIMATLLQEKVLVTGHSRIVLKIENSQTLVFWGTTKNIFLMIFNMIANLRYDQDVLTSSYGLSPPILTVQFFWRRRTGTVWRDGEIHCVNSMLWITSAPSTNRNSVHLSSNICNKSFYQPGLVPYCRQAKDKLADF